MSWLNLNQSLSSLKGQITNFASEVLSEGVAQDAAEDSSKNEPSLKELQEKCRNQELEIDALKRLNSELETTLQSERFLKKNGVADDETNWYWDPLPPSQLSNEASGQQIKELQEKITSLKIKCEDEKRVTNEELESLKEELLKERQENKVLTRNLEDLDNQHQVAMEKLLTLKSDLQKNFEMLKVEHEAVRNEYELKIKDLESKLREKNEEIKELTLSNTLNVDYKSIVHDLKTKIKEKDDEIAQLKKLDTENCSNTACKVKIQHLERMLKEREVEIDELKKSHVEFETITHKNTSHYESKIQHLESKLKESNDAIQLNKLNKEFDELSKIEEFEIKLRNKNDEITKLKVDIDTLHNKYLSLEKVHNMLKETAEKFQEENQELHEEVFKLQERLTNKEHEMELAAKHTEVSNVVPRETYELVAKELESLKEIKNSTQDQLDGVNIDDNTKSVIENLKREIVELKQKLSQKDVNETDQKIIKYDKIMQLYNKYVNFEIPIDYIGEIPSAENNKALFKLETVFKTLNTFKKDIDVLEHKLSEKNHSINHLQTQIDDLTTENDFLTTDIQHIEAELNETKKNNDFLISEIAALKNKSKLEPIIETHEDNIAKLETELADSNKLNKTFESEIKKIEKELSEVKADKVMFQQSLADLKNKYTAMLQEVEKFKTQSIEFEKSELNATIECNDTLKRTVDENDELKRKLNASNAKIEQMSIDIHIIENDKVLLTKEIDDLKHSLEEKHTKVAELHKKLSEMEMRLEEEKLKSTSSDRDDEVQLSETKKLELTEKLKEALEENTKLQNEIINLNDSLEKTVYEYNSFKKSAESNTTQVPELLKTVEILSNQLLEYQALKEKVAILKEENQIYIQKKLEAETELASTDSKILHLEKEFEKLNADLNEKDSIIDALNNNATQNAIVIQELKQNVSDLERTVQIKNQEIEYLNQSVENYTKELYEVNQVSERRLIEYKNVLQEKEDAVKQMFSLNEKLAMNDKKISELIDQRTHDIENKDHEIVCLKNKVQELSENLNKEKTALEKRNEQLEPEKERHIWNMNMESEIVRLNNTIQELSDNLNEVSTERQRLMEEKATLEQVIEKLKSEKEVKGDIEYLQERLSNVTIEHQRLLEDNAVLAKTVEKLELESQLKVKLEENLNKASVEYKKLMEERTALEKVHEALKSKLATVEKELNVTIANASREKAELINLITLKHNESVQYHAEIQRLNQVLLEQSKELNRYVEQAKTQTGIAPTAADNETSNQNQIENDPVKEEETTQESAERDTTQTTSIMKCTNCNRMKREIDERDYTIMRLKELTKSLEALPQELKDARDTIEDLKEEVALLKGSQTKEQDQVKTLMAIKEKLTEQVLSAQNSKKELERLRLHLLEVENNHTQEVMALQQKISEQQERLSGLEKSAKNNNNVYKSNSIRWNQELETLRNQLKLVESQRDQLQKKLNEMEDAKNETAAALVNLQTVLEQFQKAKAEEINEATTKIQKQMAKMVSERNAVERENSDLKAKLQEAQQGLQAGSRLSDLINSKSAQINELKEQVRILETSLAAAEDRYYKAISNQQDKVDKDLVKNLVINYVITASQNHVSKHQILRVLSTVLDFNQQECVKLGLVRNQKESEGLAVEFVKFLQDESKPRPALPNMMNLAQGGSRSSTPVSASRKSSTVDSPGTLGVSHPSPLQPSHQRNPSSGSNNLLFQNLDETASQISIESEIERRTVDLETGVTQTRNNEGAILKYVLKDM